MKTGRKLENVVSELLRQAQSNPYHRFRESFPGRKPAASAASAELNSMRLSREMKAAFVRARLMIHAASPGTGTARLASIRTIPAPSLSKEVSR